MDPTSKRQILANEMTKRLARVDPHKFEELAVVVINDFDRKLLFLGYKTEERRRIVEGWIVYHQNRKEAAEKKGEAFYKTARETQESGQQAGGGICSFCGQNRVRRPG